MTEKTEITICLGSSCFSRGNKKLVRIIDEYLKKNRLKDKVFYHGNHCFGHCDKGPVLDINGKLIEEVSENNIYDILDQHFGF